VVVRPLPFLRFEVEAEGLTISTIVLHELQFGTLRSANPAKQKDILGRFVSLLSVIDFDRNAGLHAAEIKADLLASGNLIGPNDLVIAGHARSLGVKLITGNLREFSQVDGLRCEDWLAA
jgi:tRNA(fMet)-specific endonuclease VapC